MARTKNTKEPGTRDRVRPQFAVLRTALIHIMAGRGTATSEIADALKINRSYVIRLTDFGMKPQSPAERAVMKVAAEEMSGLQRLGMGFAGKEGFETTLAGDDGRRGKGGGRPRKDAAPKAPKAAKAKPKKDSAKTAKPKRAAKPEKPAKAKQVDAAKSGPPRAKEGSRMARAEKKASPPKPKRERAPKAEPAPEVPAPATPAPDALLGEATGSAG